MPASSDLGHSTFSKQQQCFLKNKGEKKYILYFPITHFLLSTQVQINSEFYINTDWKESPTVFHRVSFPPAVWFLFIFLTHQRQKTFQILARHVSEDGLAQHAPGHWPNTCVLHKRAPLTMSFLTRTRTHLPVISVPLLK